MGTAGRSGEAGQRERHMQRLDNHKQLTGRVTNTETRVEIRSDQALALREPREASMGRETCEKVTGAARRRQ